MTSVECVRMLQESMFPSPHNNKNAREQTDIVFEKWRVDEKNETVLFTTSFSPSAWSKKAKKAQREPEYFYQKEISNFCLIVSVVRVFNLKIPLISSLACLKSYYLPQIHSDNKGSPEQLYYKMA